MLTYLNGISYDKDHVIILDSCTTTPTSLEAALEVTFDGSKSSDPEDIDYLSLDTTK
jgi:hypothetical protein